QDGFAAVAPPAPAQLLPRSPGSTDRCSGRSGPAVRAVLAGAEWSREATATTPVAPVPSQSTALACAVRLRSWRSLATDSLLASAFPPGDAGATPVAVHPDSPYQPIRFVVCSGDNRNL